MSFTITQCDTFKFDTPSGEPVAWYLAWTYSDSGIETTPKIVRNPRPKGKFTDATLQLYAVSPASTIDITDLETGANPAYEIALEDSTEIKQYKIEKAKVKTALMWTARIEGTSTFDGSGQIDTFEEIALSVDATGQQR